MLILQGVGASSGKAGGMALIHKKTIIKTHDKYQGIEAKELFYEIKELSLSEIDSLIELCKDSNETEILSAHQLILNDPEVEKAIFKEIDDDKDLIEAIKLVKENYQNIFLNMDSDIFRTKALDVEDVFERLITNIKKQSKFKTINKNFILVCDELLPTTLYEYPQEYLKGVVIKRGSLFAHGVIIAKAKNLPVVIGLGADINRIDNFDYLVIDGLSGKIVSITE
ncbi:MAG: phosphoenolpyruvate-utilizing N-terminal domain-containing protein [Candidatus Izemoplasmatales bacterium]|jgi:phosphotransferase system enzyme I (PtsI)